MECHNRVHHNSGQVTVAGSERRNRFSDFRIFGQFFVRSLRSLRSFTSFVCSLRSFVRSLRSFVRLFVRLLSFAHFVRCRSFVRSFVLSFVRSFGLHSLTHCLLEGLRVLGWLFVCWLVVGWVDTVESINTTKCCVAVAASGTVEVRSSGGSVSQLRCGGGSVVDGLRGAMFGWWWRCGGAW